MPEKQYIAPWRRGMTSFLTFIVLVYAGVCISLYVFQRSLIYFPQPEVSVRPAGTNLMILPARGADIHVTVRPRDGRKALIYFGGNAENVVYSLPDLAASFPRHAIHLMHYRGYGGSEGKPSEAALFADALMLFDEVHAKYEHVVVMGRSLGSGVATYLASQRPVSRLVLVTPFDSIMAIAQQQFPWLPVRWLLQDKYESSAYAPKIAVPTLLITAEHDEIIPLSNTKTLLEFFRPGVAELSIVAGTGHNTISESPEYGRLLRSGQ
ncbi:alpha/beta hydrolase [Allohahella marinimesophila]|uniref:Alpha/beta fold hydrolase n=1 Tax=Allohahella marinimesophila TaxID=1054972 RepID=A0ABP7NJ92_9GAMM